MIVEIYRCDTVYRHTINSRATRCQRAQVVILDIGTCTVGLYSHAMRSSFQNVIDSAERARLRRVFALTVRALRRKAGMAQEKLALETGTDRGYMSGLERGLHTPTLETIWKLLPALGVDLEQFAAEFMQQWRKKGRNKIKP